MYILMHISVCVRACFFSSVYFNLSLCFRSHCIVTITDHRSHCIATENLMSVVYIKRTAHNALHNKTNLRRKNKISEEKIRPKRKKSTCTTFNRRIKWIAVSYCAWLIIIWYYFSIFNWMRAHWKAASILFDSFVSVVCKSFCYNKHIMRLLKYSSVNVNV